MAGAHAHGADRSWARRPLQGLTVACQTRLPGVSIAAVDAPGSPTQHFRTGMASARGGRADACRNVFNLVELHKRCRTPRMRSRAAARVTEGARRAKRSCARSAMLSVSK